MTYVSRRTRIIVSTWLDECDAEYRLRAARKRSDGRLKKYGSCDDFRAWVNNNCIKHEYLSELMSDGEFSGSPPFRLFGRFVPVPVLFQLAQGSKAFEEKESSKKQVVGTRRFESDKTLTKSENPSNLEASKDVNESDEFRDVLGDGYRDTSEDAEGDVFFEIHSNTNSVRSEWEKNLLEKNLLQCTDLLDKAMHKLEKICCIVALADEEYEKARNREIEGAFSRSKLSCSCSALSSSNNAFAYSRSCLNKLRESARCTELLRKISDLRDRLKKVQECRRDVNQQIECTKRRYECVSTAQVTELYSRSEHAHVKKLQKKLEKLIAERGKILSEMCQALTSLNNIKRSSKSSTNFYARKEDSKVKEVDASDYEKCTESACSCGCKSSENSEESVKCRRPGSSSSESDANDRGYKKRKRISYQFESQSFDGRRTPDSGSDRCRSRQNSVRKSSVENNKYDNGIGSDCNLYDPNRKQQEQQQQQQQEQQQQQQAQQQQQPEQQQQQQQRQQQQEQQEDSSKREGSIDKGANLDKKCRRSSKSRAKFVCSTSPCRKKLYAEDVSDFEQSLTQEQLCIVEAAVESVQQHRRPQTSPTTANTSDVDKDKDKKTVDKSEKDTDQYNKDTDVRKKDIDTDKTRRDSGSREREPRSVSGIPYPFRGCAGNALDRRAKSETSVKQVQNSLKNYQQRLSAMEGLEDKVEGMRRKLSEGHDLRKNLAKMKAEARKQRDLDREKSEKEISRLSSENWELKKQVQELVAKFSVQSKKMENLKCGAMRARALECQAQELQKELSEYRDGFEHQRKCISKWESVVTAQRTEIENLMNHIRMLTTTKEEEPNPAFQDRRCPQRSKSYSPERYRERKSSTRPKTFARTPFIRPTSEEDNCYCESFPQPENRRMVPLRGYDRSYYTQGNGFCN